jgi:hypothetical protein
MRIEKALFIILLVFIFSCEKTGLVVVECNDCLSVEPTVADLNIKLDLSDISLIRINIYEGNLEDSILFASFNAPRNTSTTYRVHINKSYTLTAKYNIGGKNYIAVDSAFPRVKFDRESCDQDCYYVYGKDIDLRLKYTK